MNYNKRSELFLDNIKYVHKLAQRMYYGIIEKDDIIQAGLMGLYLATKKYDESKNIPFLAYASKYILGEMKREIRNSKNIILSKKMYEIIRKIKNEPNLSIEELSKDINCSKETILLAICYNEKMLSLNEQINSIEYLELISENNKDYKVNIEEVKRCLSKENYTIIYYRYFLGLTQLQIANILNITQSKVSRIEKKSLLELKKYYLNNE